MSQLIGPGAVASGSGELATTPFVESTIDARLAAADAVIYKGAIDCSANPKYPAADAGHLYRVSVAGKIGGASGTVVEVGDTLLCNTDSSAEGTQAEVGSKWNVFQVNIDGAVVGPASATDADVAVFNGTTGKTVKDGGKTVAQMLDRANHTGSQTASTVSDFDTQVRTSRLDQMAKPTANVPIGKKKVTELAEPTAAEDAATKAYVDNADKFTTFEQMLTRPEGRRLESFPRILGEMKNASVLTSGTLYLFAIILPGGLEWKEFDFHSATTAAVEPKNQWICLCDATRKILAKSADKTTEAWGANSRKTFALEAGVTPAETALYYVGLLVKATTVPTLQAKESNNSFPLNLAPILAGNSNTGLEGPGGITVGNTATALTGTPKPAYITVV